MYFHYCVMFADTSINLVLCLQVGVKEYVRCLEVAVMETFSSLSIPSFTTCNTGVWVNHPLKGESKICAIGVHTTSRG